MNQYHKIENIFNRDLKTHKLIEGDWKCNEFEYLKDAQWVFTEKIDGTNIRVIYKGGKIIFKGKTENAKIPKMLLERLEELFTLEKMDNLFNKQDVCLYGEGYGYKIQNGGCYLPKSNDFILFDVLKDDFLGQDALNGISECLQIKTVPIALKGTLNEGVNFCKNGFQSIISELPLVSEGLVAKPLLTLRSIKYKRIICKIKYKDFLGVQ